MSPGITSFVPMPVLGFNLSVSLSLEPFPLILSYQMFKDKIESPTLTLRVIM